MKSTSREVNDKLKELVRLQKEISKLERQAEEIKDEIKALMGNEEELITEDYVVSWKIVESARFDQSAFKLSHPDMYERFKLFSSTRRFSVK